MADRQLTRISAHGVCVADGQLLLVRLAPPAAEVARHRTRRRRVTVG